MKKLYDILNESFAKKVDTKVECLHDAIFEGIADLEFEEDQANIDRLNSEMNQPLKQDVSYNIPEDI